MGSIKHKGSDSILYSAAKGALVTTGVLTADSWYKINAFATSASALPTMDIGSIFKTPKNTGDAITLASGDEVYPLTLTEVCKVDLELSGEMGTIDTTDSCDYPYTTNLPDGFTALSGSINTMLRFDEETDTIVDVSTDLLGKFFNVITDDGEGTYTVTDMDDTELILMIFLNGKTSATGKVENWLITPAILTSVSANVAMKDVLKGDFSWSKGQGPACLYKRTIVAAA